MANERKPSIYVDRGTIGSSDELDEYGVWVKSEPQDLSSAGAKFQEKPDLSMDTKEETDLDFPEIDDMPDFDSIQSDDSQLESSLDEDTALKDDFDLPEIEIEEKSSDEAFEFGDLSMQEDTTEGLEDSLEDSIDDSIEDDLSMELPSLDETIEDEPSIQGIDDSVSGDFSDISIDDFSETRDTEINEPEAPAVTAGSRTTGESGGADLSTQLLMKIAEELSSIREELSSLKKEFSGIRTVSQSEEETEKDFFGEEDDEKIALTGDELNNILNTADFTEEAGADATHELSEDLDLEEAEDISSEPFPESAEEALDLGSIPEPADEVLDAIPEEEISFEEEIPADLDLDESPVQDEPVPESVPETIDDLDLDISLDDSNLSELDDELDQNESMEFITAELDFTEMDSTESTPIEEDDSVVPASELPEDISLELDNQDFNLEEVSEEVSEETLDLDSTDMELLELETPAPEASAFQASAFQAGEEIEEILPDFVVEETEELKEIREHGAEPLNFAPGPEDTDYLEHDPLADQPLAENDMDLEELSEGSDEHLDLSEAVIDEPDLSAHIQDNPLEEPSLEDISIGLDLSDLESSDDEESVSGEDLSLIPEAFIDEAEDSESPIEGIEEESLAEDDLSITSVGFAETALEDSRGIKSDDVEIPTNLQQELKVILSYLDQLLESLPDDKIEEFAKSDYYDTYKKLFKDLGLV